jgi:hypothetical protein
MRHLTPLLIALAVLLSASHATANGRYPAAGQIVVDPSDPDHIVVRATYGFTSSRDGGKTWSWICEGSVGYAGEQDPAIALTGDGTLLAGVFEGLAVSRDECGWSFAGGALRGQFTIDVSVEKNAPARAVAITATPKGGGTFVSALWGSDDHGDTWQLRGELDASLNLLTVDVAPSQPSRIYVSGIEGGSGASVLARSHDGGASWEYLPITGSDGAIGPFLSAIDPDDPDRVYLRLRAIPVDRLLVSQDAGSSWTTAFESGGTLLGFALSPDGSRVAVGGSEDGIWTAPTASLSFTQISAVRAQCLTWTAAGIYACAKQEDEQFTIGLSADGGTTFAPVMHLAGVCGVLACDQSSSVGATCPSEWPFIADAIASEEPCVASEGGSSSGSGPADPSADGATGDDVQAEGDDDARPRVASSGCATSTTPSAAWWSLVVAVAGCLALRCRARRPGRRGGRT